jgi:hypothetical protein
MSNPWRTLPVANDNADDVLESLEDVLDELAADGIRVMVVPHE